MQPGKEVIIDIQNLLPDDFDKLIFLPSEAYYPFDKSSGQLQGFQSHFVLIATSLALKDPWSCI